MDSAQFFRYKVRRSFLHGVPGHIKILCIIVAAALAFCAPVPVCAVLFVALVVLARAALHFSWGEILSDAKPTLAYAVLLYVATVVLNAVEYAEADAAGRSFLSIIMPSMAYVPLLAHLALSLQITAVFYRTTSKSQLREGFAAIERAILRRDETPVADTVALALSFIPGIASFWFSLDRAWRARGGGNSPRKIAALAPRLFQTAMRTAYEKSLALENRRPGGRVDNSQR